MSKLRLLIMAIVVAFLAGGSTYLIIHRGFSAPVYSCVNPAPGTLCATDAWYTDWTQLQSLNAEITRDQQAPEIRVLQDKMDRAIGLQTRLRQMIPQGYQWDAAKKVFVPVPPQSATPAPSAPVVAPTK